MIKKVRKGPKMDLAGFSVTDLVGLYSQTIKELKKRGILRTKNVIGELGEYFVIECYERDPDLPNLTIVPIGTKNINAISQNGDRYSIKSTSSHVTGAFYGLQPQGSSVEYKQLFEYVIVCKLDDDCGLEGIYQLSWEGFQKHKKWHSRMNAWNIAVTKAMKEDAITIFEKEKLICKTANNSMQEITPDIIDDESNIEAISIIEWNKSKKVHHKIVRDTVKERLEKKLKCSFEKSSQSRYVSADRETALFILSASYNQKNGEYWYSMNDENLPWLELFPTCYVAFALGSADQILVFRFEQFRSLLSGCLRTQEDPSVKKKAHYHFSFAVEGAKVYFKKKLPKRDFIEVTDRLM